jgi:putative heme-binding domain-containing protein
MPIQLRRNCLLVLLSICVAPLIARAQVGADELATLPDFKVELILKADKQRNGSWINLAVDTKGRLLLGGQRGQPVTRVTIKDGQVEKQEDLKLPVSETMGLHCAFDSLYVDGAGKGPDGRVVYGLWRFRDTSGEGQYDKGELLREWKSGAGEHGAHGIVLGPDKKLYIVCGNFVGLPGDFLPTSPHKNYKDDRILPRAEDGNGFGAGKVPPGGFIARMDQDGKNIELFASGQRNTYDIAFNADGELFGFDSDMEWDWGTPWYRPIRVFHAVSGGDTGFREGTAKWPEYYFDSLPATTTIGIGCPTGVLFGTGAKFPAKYQKAYYILDWSYGRLIAVHNTPKGSSYTGTWENFVAPKALKQIGGKNPLNLTDAIVGSDGALYFTIGGRNTGAGLYRVAYTGSESTTPADLHDVAGAPERQLRHQLEAFHGHQDPKAVETAWPYLSSDDRFLAYAARIAIESQPIEQWKSRALSESNPKAALLALLSVARLGGAGAQDDLYEALAKIPAASLDEQGKLEKLRIIEVAVARNGKPSAESVSKIIAELDPLYPAQSQPLNHELCQVLLALEAPDAVAKTVKLLKDSKVQEDQLVYVHHLRTITKGWTPESRQAYFSWWTQGRMGSTHPDFVLQWFADAGRPYADGSSFAKFLGNFHGDAVKTLKPEESAALQPLLAAYVAPGARPGKKTAPKKRDVVQAWKMTDIEPLLSQVSKGRNFDRGKEAYEAAQCVLCHKFGNDGGAVGPDLTAVSSRFNRHDILESIIEPSKVVSEQFQNTIVELKDGDTVDGRILEETADQIILQPNPLQPEKQTIKKSEIKSRRPSKLSPMPEGLANILSKDEVLDLLAYIESTGRKDAPMFAK